MAATSSQEDRVGPLSNNRRRGWVIASEDGTDAPRPTSFDARASAAAWNKGKGPSQASIPSRASSLTAASAPSPTLPSEPLKPDETQASSASPPSPNVDSTPVAPVPPPRIPSSSMSHNRDASSSTTTEGESSNGKRRPSPPLLVPPKQTFRKVPSTRVLPASALSDHQKFMAAARTSPSGTASSSASGPSSSRSPRANAALRSDLAKLAASRRAQSSSSSSTATTSSVATVTESSPSRATSHPASVDPLGKGKGKEVPQSPLQRDVEGFFSSSGKVRGMASAYDGTHHRQRSEEDPSSAAGSSASNQQAPPTHVPPKPSLTSLVNPLPPLSEMSANSDIEDAPSPTSDPPPPSEGDSATPSATKLGKRRESLQIEVPPPPPQFKDRYPSILVDSTHASDSEASGTSTGGQRRRRRRSTASMSNKLGGDAEDLDDDEYADDDSSWPSTPSTTPLEAYFPSEDARTNSARRTMQTTQEIIAPNAGALGMGRPMVVVTSPSTASEVSSDRRSSSGSGSTSDRTYSSSPPAVASIALAPALTKIEEDPATKADTEAPATAPLKSLSFEIPAVPRTRASEENLPIATPVRSPSRAMAFLAKMNPSKSSNRSSVDSAAVSRPSPTAASAEAAKRISLDNHQRTSADQRRSVELRPILLNSTPRPVVAEAPAAAPVATGSDVTAEQLQQRRRSIGRAAVRRNVVPYHSRRGSEASVTSSVDSHKAHERVSFDKVTFDPKSSPASQVTALTMESPAIAHQKLVSRPRHDPAPAPADSIDHRATSATTPKDRFAASMPSLRQPATIEPSVDRRSPSDAETDSRPSAIRLLVDGHKGRMTRDNDSIAEWISVSVNDLPLPNVSGAYGNGGAGHFSNEKQQQGKKQKKNKPWKLGRFAASEVVLPPKVTSTSSVVPSKRRSASFVKRSPSEEVNAAPRTSRESTTSPNKGPFMRNLGFTTANRNVILQNLCAERSISALAASTIHIAGNGRIHVPQPSPLPARKTKAKLKATKQKNQMQSSQEPPTVPVVAASSESHRPSHNAEKSQDAYLNASKDHRMGYNLSNAAGGTVKSMAPELGDWSGSSRHELGSSEEVMVEEERPFRDYEDEGSDLFDSDRSESVSDSESEEEMDYDEEDAEVPVRFGQRVNLSNRAGSGFYSAQTQTQTQIVEQLPTTVKAAPDEAPRSGNANDSKIVPSTSFERLAPGTVMLHGNDLRICVEDGEVSSRTARPLAFWKAVEVQQPQTPAPTENQIRRQPSSKAMKLEQEVATGIFAAFVGNRSPRRQAQRSSVDLSSKADQSSSEKRSASTFDARELLVSKVNKSTFSVRSETRTTSAGTEQVIEIIRRHAPRGASHTTQPSESSRASVPSHRLERAFPSPLHSSHDLTHDRSRSNRTDASLATLEDAAERTRIHIQQKVGRGFTARFQNREGQQWTWQGSKVEASVLSPRKDSSGNSALDMLEGYDLNLHTVDGSQTIELATYTADSQVRNALGLFKPRTKSVPKPLPEDVSSIGAPVLPPAQVVPLAIPVRGGAGGVGRGEPQIPLRGIRGGPLLRSQPTAAGSAARGHGLWQHQRAVVSNEAVVQVHNNAVQNVRASLLLHGGGTNAETGSTPISRDTAGSPTEETAGNKKMGVLSFSAVESLDRDLVVLTLLAVMGVAKV